MGEIKRTQVPEIFQITKLGDAPKSAFLKALVEPLSEENYKKNSECVKAFLPFTLVFRTLGLLPVKFCKGYSELIYVKLSAYKVVTLIGGMGQGFLVIRSFSDMVHTSASSGRDSVQIVESANTVIYYVHVFAITVIMLVKAKQFPDFINACKDVESLCDKYIDPEEISGRLVKKSWLIFFVIFCAQCIGQTFYYNRIVNGGNVTATVDEFITGLDSSSFFPTPDAGSATALGVFTLLAEVYCDLEWTFGEHLICVTAYLITCYFARLNRGIKNSKLETVAEIEELRRDHRALKDLVELFNSIFSPVLLVTYLGNLGYLLARLYVGVAKELGKTKNVVVLTESFYAFAFIILKIFMPSWYAAILHETAHQPLDILHDWPSLLENEDCKYRIMLINRFVSQLVTDPVHFNGRGYFALTKTFIVTLISGIIGYEVIILQFQQAAGLS